MNETLFDVSLSFSTFVIQIHGFPLMFHHEGIATEVGKRISKIHQETIN